MQTRLFILYIIIFTALSCSINNDTEKTSDYFYPSEKGILYIYDTKFDSYFIKKQIKIEDIIKKRGQVIFKMSELQEFPAALRKEIESSTSTKIPEKSKIYYEYVIQNNLIKRREISEGKSIKEYICLKGPIKKGISWKIPGDNFLIFDTNTIKPPLEKKNNYQLKKYSLDMSKADVRATIVDIKEMKVLGKIRKCIIITYDLLYLPPKKVSKRINHIYCREIGYIGEYCDGEMSEDLIKIE